MLKIIIYHVGNIPPAETRFKAVFGFSRYNLNVTLFLTEGRSSWKLINRIHNNNTALVHEAKAITGCSTVGTKRIDSHAAQRGPFSRPECHIHSSQALG